MIGALLLGSIQQIVTVTISNEINVLVVGVLLVLFVVLAPDGIVGLVQEIDGVPLLSRSRTCRSTSAASPRLPR